MHAYRDAGAKAYQRRHDHHWQDAHGRVCARRLGDQPASGHTVEPLGWRDSPHPGRLEQRLGRRVAARMVPCAVGTDTGGSVRLPAAWCGITGLKTTIGRISTYGVLPLSPTLDTPGPLTRSVEEVAVLLQVMQGADAWDPRTQALRDAEPLATLCRGVRGLRLARIAPGERDGVAADVLTADHSVEQLAEMGAEIVDLTLPRKFSDHPGNTMGRILSTEAYAHC